jgi:hypothetical protein
MFEVLLMDDSRSQTAHESYRDLPWLIVMHSPSYLEWKRITLNCKRITFEWKRIPTLRIERSLQGRFLDFCSSCKFFIRALHRSKDFDLSSRSRTAPKKLNEDREGIGNANTEHDICTYFGNIINVWCDVGGTKKIISAIIRI